MPLGVGRNRGRAAARLRFWRLAWRAPLVRFARAVLSAPAPSEPVPDGAGIKEREQQEEQTDQARQDDQWVGPVHHVLKPIACLLARSHRRETEAGCD